MIGLWIDEKPVIARGFDKPLPEGMVFAPGQKKGIPEVGIVDSENTFVMTSQDILSITGRSKGLVKV